MTLEKQLSILESEAESKLKITEHSQRLNSELKSLREKLALQRKRIRSKTDQNLTLQNQIEAGCRQLQKLQTKYETRKTR